MWEVETSFITNSFHGHHSDILDVALHPLPTEKLFVSGVSKKVILIGRFLKFQQA